ncbi:hypothetical protein [Tenacibaculum sp. SG-28]|uniref:hypothetical protein n=1 Tax=Tenacibaculum sp. SG-28 TaxID=754426 RepID=UPI001E2D7374|nr:hypothetical protein [Tenacibaculum sp. SG-28]
MLPYLVDKKTLNTKKFKTRYGQIEEIKFTVDSILKYAKFIENIYIVTDNQVPSFLNTKNTSNKYKKVKIINHDVIFKEKESFLPVFNCRPIETRLYAIPNLSEHFIYFNDDMFLIKETKPSDFFMDKKPVLRGEWKKYNEDIFYKKLFSTKNKNNKAGHKKAQEKGAKTLGFRKYYKFHHTPYPLRRSTFKRFYQLQSEIEDLNLRYRFRHFNQYTPQGLANHIEIKNKTCILKDNYQLMYFQNYKKPFWWLKFKLQRAEKNQQTLFLCMQSLDQCPPKKLSYLQQWLKSKYA